MPVRTGIAAALCWLWIVAPGPAAFAQTSDTIMRSLLDGRGPPAAAPSGFPAARRGPSEAEAILNAYTGGDADAFREALLAAAVDHPQRQEASARRDRALARTDEVAAGLYPSVEGSVSGGGIFSESVRDDLTGRARPEGLSEDLDAAITARQVLFDRGAVFDRMAAAESYTDQARFEEAEIASEQIVIAAEAYFRLTGAYIERDLTDAFLRRLETLSAQVREQYESGAATVSDVLQANAKLSAGRSGRIRVEQRLAEAVSAYVEAFGREPGPLRLPELTAALPATIEEAAQSAVTSGYRIQAARALRDGRKAEHDAARADTWPRIELEANAAQLDLNDSGGDFVGTVGLRVRWSLYDGGARDARTRAAKAALSEADHTEARVRRQLEQQARAAFSAHGAVMRRLSIAALALEEAELARGAAQDQYLVRGGSLLDLLEAERTAFQASVDWISARLEANIGQIRLLHASGRLPGWFGGAWAFGGPAKRN